MDTDALVASITTLVASLTATVAWFRHNEKKRAQEAEAAFADEAVTLRREALEGAEQALQIMRHVMLDAAQRCEEVIDELRQENEALRVGRGE
jgi:hypothetical protein